MILYMKIVMYATTLILQPYKEGSIFVNVSFLESGK